MDGKGKMGLTLSNESLGMKHIGQGKGILGLVLKKGIRI